MGTETAAAATAAAPATTVTLATPATPPAAATPPAGAGAPAMASTAASEGGAPPPETNPKLTPRFAELARREKADVQRRSELKALEAETKAYKEAKALIEKDPVAAAKSLGISLDALLQAELRGDKPETVEEKVDRLEAESKAKKDADAKAAEDAETKAIRAQVDSGKAEVRDFVTKAGETYELVNAHGAHDDVFEVIVARWHETGGPNGGVVMPFGEAAAIVEDYLFDTTSRVVKGSKKIAKLFEPAQGAQAAPPASSPAGTKAAVKAPTLSNASTSGLVPPLSPPGAGGSHEDVIHRIIAKRKATG